MQIESRERRHCRLFRSAELKGLGRRAVFIGANGSGKSTLFDLFAFLKDALTQNVAQAVARRGGFRELVSRGEEGPIGITLKFRESGGGFGRPPVQNAEDRGGRGGGRGGVLVRPGGEFRTGAVVELCMWAGYS